MLNLDGNSPVVLSEAGSKVVNCFGLREVFIYFRETFVLNLGLWDSQVPKKSLSYTSKALIDSLDSTSDNIIIIVGSAAQTLESEGDRKLIHTVAERQTGGCEQWDGRMWDGRRACGCYCRWFGFWVTAGAHTEMRTQHFLLVAVDWNQMLTLLLLAVPLTACLTDCLTDCLPVVLTVSLPACLTSCMTASLSACIPAWDGSSVV